MKHKTLIAVAVTLFAGIPFFSLHANEKVANPNASALASYLEIDTEFTSSCSYYVKPATCNAQPHCVWRGSCVPRK